MAAATTPRILFNSRKYTNACLSTFYHAPIIMNGGKTYKTVEHYYQSMKFKGTPYAEEIRLLCTAQQAKEAGSTRKHPIRADWDQVRCDVMREALIAKFTQNERCRMHLVELTGESELVHDAPWDDFWGTGRTGQGKNMLGIMLMELRDKLRRSAEEHDRGANGGGAESSAEEESPEQEIARLRSEVERLKRELAELKAQQQQQQPESSTLKRPRV